MKTILKTVLFPVLAILLAIGSSFATRASEKTNTTTITCHVTPLGSAPCSISTQCSNTPGALCTLTYLGIIYPVYAKLAITDTNCEIVCYKQN